MQLLFMRKKIHYNYITQKKSIYKKYKYMKKK